MVCRKHPDLKFELTSKGELVIMPPTLPDTGWKNSRLNTRTDLWSLETNSGFVFDSSTIFTFRNGAKRSPDVAWIAREKWDQFTAEQKKKISKITPDFVIELRSENDTVKSLQAKMREYIENGAQLGWLIYSKTKQVFIYTPNKEVEILENPSKVSGEPLLTGFELDLTEIW